MSIKAAAAAYALGDEEFRRGFNVKAESERFGVSRQTFYNYVKRVTDHGLDGLERRSSAPGSTPHKTPDAVEDEIVGIRKRLQDQGLDHGARTIHWHLEQAAGAAPSVSTIHNVLVRRGQVNLQPKKRPKASYVRFEAGAPNEMWQIDHTEWEIRNGVTTKIFNIIDDHSRVLIRSMCVIDPTTKAAWRAFSSGAQVWGLPSQVLSDNGLCFSGKLRKIEVFFEQRLRDAGIRPITSRPFHPQTTGKVERFQLTLKTWLSQQDPAESTLHLQSQLDTFAQIYNFERPHQGISRAVPAERWHGATASGPASDPLAHPRYERTRLESVVTPTGCVSAGPYLIHVGAEHTGQAVVVIRDANTAAVFIDDELVRHLTLNLDRHYQPSGRKRGGTKRQRLA